MLKGEYGATAAPVNSELQARVLDGKEAITCRPADLLDDELATLENDLLTQAKEQGITLADNAIDDVLTYALFPQIGLKFLKNRNNPDAFEPVPTGEEATSLPAQNSGAAKATESYSVRVDGKVYAVEVAQGGALTDIQVADNGTSAQTAAPAPVSSAGSEEVAAPLAGNVFKLLVRPGDTISEGDVIVIMEAMKMETEIRSTASGTILDILVKEGDAVQSGQTMLTLG